jgi:hypothetical protein
MACQGRPVDGSLRRKVDCVKIAANGVYGPVLAHGVQTTHPLFSISQQLVNNVIVGQGLVVDQVRVESRLLVAVAAWANRDDHQLSAVVKTRTVPSEANGNSNLLINPSCPLSTVAVGICQDGIAVVNDSEHDRFPRQPHLSGRPRVKQISYHSPRGNSPISSSQWSLQSHSCKSGKSLTRLRLGERRPDANRACRENLVCRSNDKMQDDALAKRS